MIQQNDEKENEVKRFPLIAGFLSFLLPGLGQLYNGQLGKAVLLYILMFLHPQTCFIALSGFPAFLYFYALKVGLVVYAVGDACYNAGKIGSLQPGFYQRWYIYLIVCIITALALPIFANATILNYVRTFHCPSTSMSPTLLVGDKFLVDMGYYKNHVPGKGELIALDPPECGDSGGKLLIKRVIALGGESFQVKNGKVFVNDIPVEEPYVCEPIKYDMDKIKVPEGTIFVLGDNRNNSDDSHIWGGLDIKRVRGKPLYIFWPPSRAGREL